jgi:hypothetical protein
MRPFGLLVVLGTVLVTWFPGQAVIAADTAIFQ